MENTPPREYPIVDAVAIKIKQTLRSLEPSPVLLAMGYPPALARAAIRFSLWSGNTAEEIERVCDVLPRIVARARS